jgi:DNA topoisomerase-3
MSQEKENSTAKRYPTLGSFFARSDERNDENFSEYRDVKRSRVSGVDEINALAAASNTAPAEGESVSPLCQCQTPSVRKVVQKDGPNKGKPFFACGQPRDSQCGFFQWDNQTGPSKQIHGPSESVCSNSSAAVASAEPSVNCRCMEPAVLRTVQKEGPNRGKMFWSCSKPKDSICNFFQWNDYDIAAAAPKPAVTQSAPSFRSVDNSTSSGSQCYKCGSAGHWAKNCPTAGAVAGGSSASSSQQERKCYSCGEGGHYSNSCPTKRR